MRPRCLWVDRFGNCQLNIGPDEIAGWGARSVEVRARSCAGRVGRRLRHARSGRWACSSTGSGMLTLVLDRRSAAEELGVVAGDR